MSSTHQNILTRINTYSGGAILFPCDFRGLGSEDSIKMSLSRHTNSGILERLASGIYMKVKTKGDTKRPSIEKIAFAIAKKERIKIKPAGAFVLHKLGLKPDLPSDIVYITDGEPRNISIGNQRLIFKATTPKKLRLSNSISGMLIQGLEEIGKNSITDGVRHQIIKHLRQENEKNIMADLRLAPAWIYDLLYKLNQELTR